MDLSCHYTIFSFVSVKEGYHSYRCYISSSYSGISFRERMQYLMSGEPFWLPPFWKWIWLNFHRKRNKSQFFAERTMDWGLGPARHPFHVFLKNASSTNWTCGKWGSSIPPLFPFLRLNCKGNIFFSYFTPLCCIQSLTIPIIMDGTSSSLSGNLKEKLLKNWRIWSESEFRFTKLENHL